MQANVPQSTPLTRSLTLPWWRQLRWSLILYFILLAVLPLTVVTYVILDQTGDNAGEQTLDQLESVATLKQNEVTTWIVENQDTLRVFPVTETNHNGLVTLATSASPSAREAGQALINAALFDTVASHDDFTEMFYYDTEGLLLASTDPVRLGQRVVQQPYFQPSLTAEFAQPPYYEVGTNELAIVITVPVIENGRTVGVLAAKLDTTVLGQIMIERAGLGATGNTYLVSAQSNYLLTPSRFEGYELNRAYHSLGIDRALAGQNGEGVYNDYRDVPVFGVYRWVPELQAALVAEIDEAEAFETFNDVRSYSLVFGAVSALAAVLVGLFVATRFSRPITTLTEVATRIAGGDLTQRSRLRQRNELGVLAAAFNGMTDRVQGLIGSLQARERDLFLTLEVGQLATRISQREDLLTQVVEFIRERFNLYYTQVYLIDDAQRDAVLAAGTGEVGQVLLDRKHRLALTETAIVTRAAQTRRPILVEDTAASEVHKPNPLLPDTRSEVAIPLIVGNDVIGVLDMQAVQADTFREDNLPVFEAMASQLASALRASEAYVETQAAIQRADAINRRLTGEAWESYLGRMDTGVAVGFVYDLQTVQPISRPVVAGRDRAPGNGSAHQIVYPVTVRGQAVGAIQVDEVTDREWTPEDHELIRDVADRVALALEQFRAFDETQRRAAEMQTVAEVGAEASSTLDPDRLLWNTVELIKQRFNLYHAHIYLLDETGENLLLAAGAGEPGRLMVARGHRIATNHAHSLVARAARTQQGVIANDVTHAPDFLPNPLLPDTQAELATPMIVGDRVIGVLDVQADTINRFTDEDVRVQSTLAAQVAVAVQNARSFTTIRDRGISLEKEQAAFISLVRDPAFSQGDLSSALRQVTQIAAEVLGVERVSVWFYNPEQTGIECHTLYERTPDRYSSGVALNRADYPSYFSALDERGVILADEAHTHPDTREFSENYLTPLGIQSMMDIPIHAGEQTVGVLCHEHVASTSRHWTLEDQVFANSLAVMVSLALEAAQRNESQRALAESQAMLSLVMNNVPQAIFWKDRDLRYLGANAAFAEDAGLSSPNQLIGKDDFNMVWRDQADLYRADDWRVIESGQAKLNFEEPQTTPDGSTIWLRTSKVPLRSAAGDIIGVLGMYEDVTERKQAEEDIRKLSQAVEQSPTTVVITDLHGNIEYVNAAFVRGSGYTREEAIGQNPRILKSGYTPDEVYREMWQVLSAGGTWQGELLNRKKNGDLFWEQVAITPIRNAQGEVTHYLAVKQDITERKRNEETIRKRAVEMQAVAEVGAAAASTLDPSELLWNVANLTKERFNLYHTHIYLLDEAGDNLLLVAGAGSTGQTMVRAGHRIAASHERSLVARAARTRQGVIANDVANAPDFLPNPMLPETRSELAVPMIVGEQVIGVLDVQSSEIDHFTDEDLRVQSTLAAQIAVAVTNARLFDQTQRRAAEMQTVAEVGAEASSTLDQNQLLWSVVTLVKERFGLYHVHIYLLDETGENLVLAAGAGEAGRMMVAARHRISTRHEHSLVARAARMRQSVIVNDVTAAPDFLPNPLLPRTRSELATPMIVGGEVIGVLDVQSNRVNSFSVEDMQVQSTLASQIAVAVNNAQLFTEQINVAAQLREVDRLKSEFLASMSHELRTPLNSIIGYAEVLIDGIDGELTPDMTEDVSAIHGSGKHLLNLINDILDLAKIEAGQMDLVVEDFALRPLAEETANIQRVLLKDKPVDLVIDMPDDLPQVHADPLRVRQVISNLITNAIKFTEQGSITIHAEQYHADPAMLQISVRDTGIGMRPDQLQVIFDRFRQVDQSHTRRAGGTGLGLSITRQLVEMHSGTIWVESEAGVGSTFNFTLPIAVE